MSALDPRTTPRTLPARAPGVRWIAPAMCVAAVVALGCGSKRDEGEPPPREAAPVAHDAATTTDALSQRDLERITADMVRIPAGPTRFGCWKGDEPCIGGGTTDVPEFFIDRTEVTVAQYRQCVDAGACTPPATRQRPPPLDEVDCPPEAKNSTYPDRDEHPVNCVTAAQAGAYCAYRGKVLPTARQWEKAARGTDGRPYPWGAEPPTCDRAIMAVDKKHTTDTYGCGTGRTWPVGSRPTGASPYGLLDMVGNVAEWTVDPGWYDITVDPRDADMVETYARVKGASFADEGPSQIFDNQLYGVGRDVFWSHNGIRCAYNAEPLPFKRL